MGMEVQVLRLNVLKVSCRYRTDQWNNMKITDIRAEYYQWKRKVAIANGKHIYPYAGIGIVRVDTDSEIYGIGYTYTYFIEHFAQAFEYFKDIIADEDPFDTERLWRKMWIPKLVGRRGMSTRLISAIDIALWDIKAKYARLPLYKLLGAAKDRIPVYAAGGYYVEGKVLMNCKTKLVNILRADAMRSKSR